MYRQNSKPVSVLSRHLSSQPTPWKRAGSPFALADVPVYLVLQAPVPSPSYVATRRREPLPHGFTLALAGGLFSVTASIRLLPSVLSTAGRPFLSGLSSEQGSEETVYPQSLSRQPRGAFGLHFVPTGDLLSFRLFQRHGSGRDGCSRPDKSESSKHWSATGHPT